MMIDRQFAPELCFKEACRRVQHELVSQHEEFWDVFGQAAAINAETAARLDASEKRHAHERRRRERIFEALTGYHRPVDTD